METVNIFKYLTQQIHTVVTATANEAGKPITCAIDIMDYDDNCLYFLTAKGKSFYRRLKENGYISLTGIKGENTMSRAAITVYGSVKELGDDRVQKLLDNNPYMYKIYPTPLSRSALAAFCIYEGEGEWFDLSKKPIQRLFFSFGASLGQDKGYYITDKCIGCGKCLLVCPQSCIDLQRHAAIRQVNCLHCGNCQRVCPHNAIITK